MSKNLVNSGDRVFNSLTAWAKDKPVTNPSKKSPKVAIVRGEPTAEDIILMQKSGVVSVDVEAEMKLFGL